MVAPTPVSTYLHSATMVTAGVYLVARLAPAFATVGVWRPLVLTIGLVTMIAGGLRALRQHDLKLLLAFGTVSQLGFLFVLIGRGHGRRPRPPGACCWSPTPPSRPRCSWWSGSSTTRPAPATCGRCAASARAWRLASGRRRGGERGVDGRGTARLRLRGQGGGLRGLRPPPVRRRRLWCGPGWSPGRWSPSPTPPASSGAPSPAGTRTDWAERPAAGGRRATAPAAVRGAGRRVLVVVTVVLGVAPRLAGELDRRGDDRARAGRPPAAPGAVARRQRLARPVAAGAGGGGALFVGRRPVAARAGDRAPPAVGRATVTGRRCGASTSRGRPSDGRRAERVAAGVRRRDPAHGSVLPSIAARPSARVGRLARRSRTRRRTSRSWPSWCWRRWAAVVARRRLAAVLFLARRATGWPGCSSIEGAPDLALTQVAVETLSTVVFVLVLRGIPERFRVERPEGPARADRGRRHGGRLRVRVRAGGVGQPGPRPVGLGRDGRPRRCPTAAARTWST